MRISRSYFRMTICTDILMTEMKKIYIVFCLVFSLIAQSQESNNFFVKNNDEKILMHRNIKNNFYEKNDERFSGDYALTGEFLWYHNEEGGLKRIRQSKVREVLFDKKHYTNLKIGSLVGFNRLHEIIIESNDYILTQYYFNYYYFVYLLDKKKEKFVFKKQIVKRKFKKDNKLFEDKIMPHFKECSYFIEKVRENLANDYWGEEYVPENLLFDSLSNLKCE